MNKELYDYLEQEFRYCNMKKYYDRFFELWINNITENQIIGFTKQMKQCINESMIEH